MEEYINADALKGKTIGIEWCDETKTLSFHEHIDDDAPTAPVAPIADTVKKMQERLKELAFPESGCGWDCVYIRQVDGVAKEILEGTQDD